MATSSPVLDAISEGLDEKQSEAMQCINGPVRIIAGAGAGKTRTITRRIAYAVASKQWDAKSTLAVTYTNKAAEEMKMRLLGLGVHDVQASTFHSAAMSQLAYAWNRLADGDVPRIETDMSQYVRTALLRVTGHDDLEDQEVSDIMQELSWMKVNLVPYEDYARVCARTHRTIPLELSPQQFVDVAHIAENEKIHKNVIDFDDSLLLLSHILDEYEEIADELRKRMRHITVDEYQDVSPLQHRVLTQWLGGNRDICVVGDPAQTIYSYAGASSYYLLNFNKEFSPLSADVELDTDYRSSGHIVNYANAVLSASPMADDYIELRSANDSGPQVTLTKFATDEQQRQQIVSRILWHSKRDMKLDDIAILCRTRARARAIASTCKQAQVPYRLRTEPDDGVLHARQEDGKVTISTIHAAKGLEWDTVFIPDCFEGNIPMNPEGTGQAHEQQIEEERRVFYVALTRGEKRAYLCVARSAHENDYTAQRTISRFISDAAANKRKVRS
ncbi:ATP-dependent helicase [Alloscardovia venturai]|uniref:DNA 3'-5' helicase n=1 Tax=Alloscardovia venturai TaxID=1769421 RepID=A0ABW2Y4N7_9BIFI